MDQPPTASPEEPLGQPTRARLFSMLSDLKRPAPTEELARRSKLHPNSVRLHMARLLEAELVERVTARRGRGRPRYEWRVAPGARPGGAAPVAYADLARWLGRLLQADATDPRSVEDAGVEIGRDAAPRNGGEEVGEMVEAALAALGFQPKGSAAGSRVRFRLGNCPYRDAVAENPLICALHRGMVRGLLETAAPDARLAEFVPKDPYRAGCLVEIETRTEEDR